MVGRTIFLALVSVVFAAVEQDSGHEGQFERKGFLSSKSFQTQEDVLLMKSAMKTGLVPADSLLAALPHSLTTFVSPVGKDELTLRQFLNQYIDNKELYLDQPVVDTFRALLPIPEILQCPFFTSNFVSSRMYWRWAEKDELEHHTANLGGNSLHCVLDGQGTFVWSQKIKKEETKAVKPGDCLYLPPKQSGKWVLRGRIVMFSLSWSGKHPSSQKCSSEDQAKEKVLADFAFKEDPPTDILGLLSMNTMTTFLESYHLSVNCTRDVFNKKFKKNSLKKLQEWDPECQEIANELFQEMDFNKDGVLTVEDVEDLKPEDLRHLAGVLEDRLADIGDIAADQDDEKPKTNTGPLAMAKEMAVDYEKELQAILEEGFNEILMEANIKGKVKFDKDGNPSVTREETEGTNEQSTQTKSAEERENKESTNKQSTETKTAEEGENKEKKPTDRQPNDEL